MSTPTCPGCGTKFSWDRKLQCCKVCGITAEVIEADKVQDWKRARARAEAPSKREFKKTLHRESGRRRKYKHGRKGAKRELASGNTRPRYRRATRGAGQQPGVGGEA